MVMPTYGHSRAGFTGLAGRMRPAGRQLDNAALDGVAGYYIGLSVLPVLAYRMFTV